MFARTLSLTTLSLSLAGYAAAQDFRPPLACGPDGCFIQNFADMDAGSGVADLVCGPLSYDGHDGLDFRITGDGYRRGVDVLAPCPHWSADAKAALTVSDARWFEAGFAGEAPQKDPSLGVAMPRRDASALVFWALAVAPKSGDLLKVRIAGPDRKQVAESERAQQRDQAQAWLLISGESGDIMGAQILEMPTTKVGPVAQIAADQTLAATSSELLEDPCA